MSQHNLKLEKAKIEVIAAAEHYPDVKVVQFLANGLFGIEMEVATSNVESYLAFDKALRQANLLPSIIVPHRNENQYWLRVEVQVPQNWQPTSVTQSNLT